MLSFREIDNKKTWEDFLLHTYQGFFPFFQTWNWGEVQKMMHFSILRLGLFEEEKLVGVALIVEVKAKRGHYLHVRHGPVLETSNKVHLDAMILHIKEIAKEKASSFIRISPLIEKNDDAIPFLQKHHFFSSPIPNMDSETCWVLDITKPEEILLTEMRKTHRYLIKKARIGGVTIEKSNDPKDLESFFSFYTDLAKKKHFVPHRGIVEEMEIFGRDDQILLFQARYQGKIISSAIILFVGDIAIYHHSASDNRYREIPSSYLLQWEVIREAKRREKKLYNFWGIAPVADKNHAWHGLTLFKTGFGGEKKEFLHAQDLPLSPWYIKTYAIEMIGKIRKGY